MEKLNIVWIKKWKIKRNLISVMTKIKAFFEKRNWNYVAIIAIIFGGAVVVYTSCWINDSDRRNIAVGIGTGIITSALVTLYLEIINAQIERKKLQKYKKMIFSPLCDSVRKLYIHIILNIDEYRVREEKKTLFFIPMKETKEISDFFKKMQEIDIESITEEKEKRKLEEFSTISLVYFKEIISQYEGLPFESLLLDNIITQEEYDNLKHFTLINECKKCIHMLSDNNMLDKDKYYTSVHLNHCMLLFMNRLARMFKFIEVQIEAENKWIKTHLDDIYYNEVYLFSDEYVEQWAERAEAEAEYYAEHPEAFEDMEESEEDRLFEKIIEAIWAGDVETIKKCFPQIDKNDKQIQAELTWIVAKDVMKNRELRELYFQKYGVKYKVRKEKRRNS